MSPPTGWSAVLVEPGRFEMREYPLPEIGPDDAILAVELASICGSDFKLYEGVHTARIPYPIVLGHETVGWIHQIGERAAQIYGVGVGDRVCVEPYVNCGHCRYCLNGAYQHCRTRTTYGITQTCAEPPHQWGGLGEYLYVAPGSKLQRVAEGVPAEAGCLISVIGNGVRWVRTRGRVRLGESVVVLGPGAIGLATVVAAREAGASPVVVIGLARDEHRLALACELGADAAIVVDQEDAVARVRDLTAGEMADVAIECSGSPASQLLGLELLRPQGRYVLAGTSGNRELTIRPDLIVRAELEILGGLGQAWDCEPAAKIVNARRYPLERIVTHHFGLRQAEEALLFARSAPPGSIKVGIDPRR